jgi:hypothetical protein
MESSRHQRPFVFDRPLRATGVPEPRPAASLKTMVNRSRANGLEQRVKFRYSPALHTPSGVPRPVPPQQSWPR